MEKKRHEICLSEMVEDNSYTSVEVEKIFGVPPSDSRSFDFEFALQWRQLVGLLHPSSLAK